MSKQTTKLFVFILLFLSVAVFGWWSFSSFREAVKDSSVTYPLAVVESKFNDELLTEGKSPVTNLNFRVGGDQTLYIEFDTAGSYLGNQISGKAKIFGWLEYGAFSNHFKFNAGSVAVTNVHLLCDGGDVALAEAPSEFVSQIHTAVGNAFDRMTVSEVSGEYVAWAWRNSVSIDNNTIVVKYSFAHMTFTILASIAVFVILVLLLIAFCYCPECFLFLFLSFDS